MTEKVTRTEDELSTLLDEQIDHLRSSCLAFDEGKVSEASRVALAIRVLLHETRNSRSLLAQLEKLDQPFLDSAAPLDDDHRGTHSGLIMVELGKGDPKNLPWLEGPFNEMLSFDDWWNKPVFRDQKGRSMSRKDLVLTAADQDGGAHVDPKIDGVYHGLAKGNTLGQKAETNGQEVSMNSPVAASIRQIGHEVLKTLLGDYGFEDNKKGGMYVGGMKLTFSKTTDNSQSSSARGLPRPATSAGIISKVGRNEPCPCGSGEKYKRCHGQ